MTLMHKCGFWFYCLHLVCCIENTAVCAHVDMGNGGGEGDACLL